MAAEPDDARHGDELPVIEPPATRSSGTKFPGTESRVTRPAGARLPATRPADVGPPVPGPSVAELLALLEADGELTAEQAAALARLDDGPPDPADDDPWDAGDELWDGDPAARPPPPAAAAGPAAAEVLEAGFTHRQGGHARGFAAGGALDQMEPGGVTSPGHGSA